MGQRYNNNFKAPRELKRKKIGKVKISFFNFFAIIYCQINSFKIIRYNGFVIIWMFHQNIMYSNNRSTLITCDASSWLKLLKPPSTPSPPPTEWTNWLINVVYIVPEKKFTGRGNCYNRTLYFLEFFRFSFEQGNKFL